MGVPESELNQTGRMSACVRFIFNDSMPNNRMSNENVSLIIVRCLLVHPNAIHLNFSVSTRFKTATFATRNLLNIVSTLCDEKASQRTWN